MSNYAGLGHALLPEAALGRRRAGIVLGFDLAVAPATRRLERSAPRRWRSAAVALSPRRSAAFESAARARSSAACLMLDPLAVAARLGVLALALLVARGGRGRPRPAQSGRICRHHPVRHHGLHPDGRGEPAAARVSRARAREPLALRARRFQQIESRLGRGRAEIFPLRRHLGGLSALRFQPALRADRLDRTAADRRGRSPSAEPSPLLAIALVMVLVGFGFKAAAAPFHLWAPDVYQGAPAPAAALIASASKLAGLVLFLRLLWPGLGAAAGSVATGTARQGWLPVVAVHFARLAPARQSRRARADQRPPAARLLRHFPRRRAVARRHRRGRRRPGAALLLRRDLWHRDRPARSG